MPTEIYFNGKNNDYISIPIESWNLILPYIIKEGGLLMTREERVNARLHKGFSLDDRDSTHLGFILRNEILSGVFQRTLEGSLRENLYVCNDLLNFALFLTECEGFSTEIDRTKWFTARNPVHHIETYLRSKR
tara:strand:+ start:9 stop:407 length:399 start_codon:yes stop_codon:yes gene_type:complete